jgi:small subunit ribosomal protein S20
MPGRDNPDNLIALEQWQQADGGGLNQLIVIERALPPGNMVERLERRAKRPGKRREIGFFSYCVAANQDIVGTQPCRSRSFFRCGDNRTGQNAADAVDFRADPRRRLRPCVLPGTGGKRSGFHSPRPLGRLKPADHCPFRTTQRHRRPPAVTDSLICPCSTREVLPRGNLSLQHRDAWRRQWQYASVDGGVPHPYKPTFAKLSRRKLSRKVMANTKSAKKAARQIERRTVINRARRSRLRSAVRKVEEAIAAGDRSRALAAMAEAEPVIVRAAQKNVVHRNAARRKVSRLAHRIAALGK